MRSCHKLLQTNLFSSTYSCYTFDIQLSQSVFKSQTGPVIPPSRLFKCDSHPLPSPYPPPPLKIWMIYDSHDILWSWQLNEREKEKKSRYFPFRLIGKHYVVNTAVLNMILPVAVLSMNHCANLVRLNTVHCVVVRKIVHPIAVVSTVHPVITLNTVHYSCSELSSTSSCCECFSPCSCSEHCPPYACSEHSSASSCCEHS